MCGLAIVLSRKNKQSGQRAYQVYADQAQRGKRGYGYVALDKDNKVTKVFRCKTEDAFKKALTVEKAPKIFLHHRLPTSTKNTVGTTHPLFVSNDELEYDYLIAHNGVISNSIMRKQEHNAAGYVYTSEFYEETQAVYNDGTTETISNTVGVFNDSESLAIDLARYQEGHIKEIKSTGASAFWGIAVKKDSLQASHYFYGRNEGRPLCHKNNKKWRIISSETGESIKSMVVNEVSLETEKITEKKLDMPAYVAPRTTPNIPSQPNPPTQNRMGFNREYQQLPTPSQGNRNMPSHASTQLENKYYTYSEMVGTGVNARAFEMVFVDNIILYVPLIYKNYPENRQPRSLDKLDQQNEDSKQYNKELDQLEKIAIRIAEVENELSEVYGYSEDMEVEETNYAETMAVAASLESELAALEEKTAALGLDEETIEEYIELARDVYQTTNYQ